jgi:hypothetical protein
MDHSTEEFNIAQEEKDHADFEYHINENGKLFTVPYRIIKEVTFTSVKKEELIDIPHAARLQYRLMLLDPIIKARVDYTKSKITVIYNPRTANNMREKISLEEVIEFLVKEGIHVASENTTERDYDYKKELYDYAYSPPIIRETAPYGYTKEAWQIMKPEYEEKLKKGEIEKKQKFRKFQEEYLEEVDPEMAQVLEPGYKPSILPVKTTFLGKLFGSKKKNKEKGFWFHGV